MTDPLIARRIQIEAAYRKYFTEVRKFNPFPSEITLESVVDFVEWLTNPPRGPICDGYPYCDGRLPGEPHEPSCPAYTPEPRAEDRQ